MIYDSVVVGGGIAGLQAAIQLGRYEHRVVVIDAGYGRSTLCRRYHNVLGWPDGISGEELRSLGRRQAEQLGVSFVADEVVTAQKTEAGFTVTTKQSGQSYTGMTLLIATGLLDRFPSLPGLVPCLGLTIYVCPDCDGYEVKDKRTLVLGSGDAGAGMAIALTYWTKDIQYINHERKEISDKLQQQLREHGIRTIDEPVREVLTDSDGSMLRGVKLQNGEVLAGERGFIAFGGNEVKSGLAEQLGIERLDNKHILTDPRTKMTNVPHVWAAGDIGVHSEQLTIAMGEGMQAAIWMHKTVRKQKSITLKPFAETTV